MRSSDRLALYCDLLRNLAARHRVRLNRVVFVLILVVLSHPRIRFVFAFGFIIALIGATLRLWASLIPPNEPDGLITNGPYRFVRHPMYLGTMIEACGVWLACFSFRYFFSFVLFGIILGSYMLFVYKEAILIEEEELSQRWPSQWEAYISRTPILLPAKTALTGLKNFNRQMLDLSRLEKKEWKNYLACIGVFAFLWFKLVYKL
ncbi:MAG: hypothetical protein HY747_01395 [Elusimicrobia bacterium]|nr:hypothetical protein [Elusimicrobiota bacterium]